MGKKRKSSAETRLDEVDRSLYSSFCTAANSLSQFYTQSMNHQRLSFQAGELHSLDKLYQWILRQQEDGARVSTMNIISYLQNELEYGPEDSPVSPRVPFLQHHSQMTMPTSSPCLPMSSTPTGSAQRPASAQGDDHLQGKNSVFSDALSSPVRRTLQNYHLTQGEVRSTEGNNPIHQQTRETNPASSNDSSMDMHSESPGHDSHY